MKTAVVIVNYKTPDLVIKCLETIGAEVMDSQDIKVFIGDAASGDGSVEKIKDFIDAEGLNWAECYAIGENGGFAYGNNHVVRKFITPDSDFEFVHFLNPDTYIRPGAITTLIKFLTDHPRAAIVGSKLENPDGSARAYGFRFPAPWREFFRGAKVSALSKIFPTADIKIPDLNDTQQVDWVSGASFMIRRSALDQVGLMDDRYFLYFEETDLMYRVRECGFEIWHVASSRIVHIAGQATGIRADNPTPPRIPRYWFQSRYKFFRDHYGWHGAVLANLLFLLGNVVYRSHRVLRLKPFNEPPYLWRDFIAYGFSAPPKRRS